ncbi:MAG TPA: TetR/AcrR family transcriptional regulator, partial [Acidimicrobiales bacterium]
MTRSATSRDRRRVGRPPGPPPDPAERREAILDAAERVIRAQGPDVGMQDIAAGLGLTKPAVYRSLGDKAALSAALGRRVAKRLGERLAATLGGPGDLHGIVVAAIDVFCAFVDEDPHLYRFIVHGSKGAEPAGFQDRPLVARLAGVIATALRAALGDGADEGLADTWAYAIIGAVFSATEHWRHDPAVP